jgi:tRNA threonylcarbamoyladenosine modification (KEOPS) complex  Pcc1 subunit
MRYRCELAFVDPHLMDSVQDEGVSSERGRCSLEQGKIVVEASDAVALRATLNSALRLIIVHEKMMEVR